MSIDAEVSRKVVFSYVEEFWNYIKKREEIKSLCIEFTTFHDVVFLAKYGCPCNTDELISEAIEMYKKFNLIGANVWAKVKSDIGCDNIIFNLEDQFLFEL